MTIVRKQKEKILQEYIDLLKDAECFFVINNYGIDVKNEVTKRKNLKKEGMVVKTIRKRLFLKALEEVGKKDSFEIDKVKGYLQLLVVGSEEEGIKGLKVYYDLLKEFKKAKEDKNIEFLGGYMGGKWYDSEYVTQLASIPSKEELIGKLLYLMKYPIQGFVVALNGIGEKLSDDKKVGDLIVKKEESSEEVKSNSEGGNNGEDKESE